jgi:hypothetical protein
VDSNGTEKYEEKVTVGREIERAMASLAATLQRIQKF